MSTDFNPAVAARALLKAQFEYRTVPEAAERFAGQQLSELDVYGLLFTENSEGSNPGDFDPVDFSYLVHLFAEHHELNYERLPNEQLAHIWEVAENCALSITRLLDFEDGSWGVFAYDHLSGDLGKQLTLQVYAVGLPADPVITDYADERGLPRH